MNDLFSFDVRVKGWTGGSATLGTDDAGSTMTAQATIGTTPSFVSVEDSTFVAGSSRMDTEESLEFSVENVAFDFNGSNVEGEFQAKKFTSARLEQTSNTGNSHRAIFGSGSNLLGWNFPNDQESGALESGMEVLYLSAEEGGGTRSTAWGVANVDFDLRFEVIRLGTAYDNWTLSFFGQSGPADEDPDHDGIRNLLEYVLNGDPTVADTSIRPFAILGDGNPKIRFQRRVESKEDTHQIFQLSPDLVSWSTIDLTAAPSPMNVTTTAISAEVEEVTIELDASAADDERNFFRLGVEQD